MQKAKDILQTILTLAIIAGITTVLYLYTAGYRLKKDDVKVIDLTKTGMVNAKSIPESAGVYIDGKLITATNGTVPGLTPGKHVLKIVKKGFFEWSKEIDVFQEMVTDITAVLVSQSPRIEPLTNTGAKFPIISPTLSKLAYFSEDPTEPGIYVVPLGGFNVSLFRSNPNIAIKDTKVSKYSQGNSIEWSPNEKNLLIQGPGKTAYLVDLEKNTAETTASPDLVRKSWKEDVDKKRQEVVDKIEISTDVKQSEDIKKLGLSEGALWSPDDKKFLIAVNTGMKIQYKVYNLEKPLPVGEKMENLVFETDAKAAQPKLNWYPDSFHLIMVNDFDAVQKRGSISLIRIDGTNKTEIYSNTLFSPNVFSSPDGEKVIISTSFKSSGQTDLYTVSIR